MKTLKLLSKFYIILLLFFTFVQNAISNEPVDIWNIEKDQSVTEDQLIENKKTSSDENIIETKIVDQTKDVIVNNSLNANQIKLAGLYDPAENGLSIDMWTSSNGEEIKFFLEKLSSTNLSNFSEKILDVALLTNSYLPSNNISSEEFVEFKGKY